MSTHVHAQSMLVLLSLMMGFLCWPHSCMHLDDCCVVSAQARAGRKGTTPDSGIRFGLGAYCAFAQIVRSRLASRKVCFTHLHKLTAAFKFTGACLGPTAVATCAMQIDWFCLRSGGPCLGPTAVGKGYVNRLYLSEIWGSAAGECRGVDAAASRFSSEAARASMQASYSTQQAGTTSCARLQAACRTAAAFACHRNAGDRIRRHSSASCMKHRAATLPGYPADCGLQPDLCENGSSTGIPL